MQYRFAEVHLCMKVYVDVDADVHVNEICRSLQKLWTLGKIIPLWPRRALPAAGMFSSVPPLSLPSHLPPGVSLRRVESCSLDFQVIKHACVHRQRLCPSTPARTCRCLQPATKSLVPCPFGLKFEPATDEEPFWFPCTRQARNDVRADAVALQRVCARRRGAPSADVSLADTALEWLHGSANVVASRSLIGLKLGWTVDGHVFHLSCARQLPSSPSHAAAANSVWMCRRGEGVPLLHQRHGGDRRLIQRHAGPH